MGKALGIVALIFGIIELAFFGISILVSYY